MWLAAATDRAGSRERSEMMRFKMDGLPGVIPRFVRELWGLPGAPGSVPVGLNHRGSVGETRRE